MKETIYLAHWTQSQLEGNPNFKIPWDEPILASYRPSQTFPFAYTFDSEEKDFFLLYGDTRPPGVPQGNCVFLPDKAGIEDTLEKIVCVIPTDAERRRTSSILCGND